MEKSIEHASLDWIEKEFLLEMLIQDAVDNDSHTALSLLRRLDFIDNDGKPIIIDWDKEVMKIKEKVKAGLI